MLYLTNEDKGFISEHYKSFLVNLKHFIEHNQLKSWLECYAVIVKMLRSGQFCVDSTIDFNMSFPYLALPNMDEQGAQVMFGVCCCRHVNSLVNDILQSLGFPTKLQYIFIDEDEEWHRSTPSGANHVVIGLRDGERDYLLDAVKNFVAEVETNGNLKLIDFTRMNNLVDSSTYSDSNIQEIGKVLKKYYMLRDAGVDHVYDYSY